MNSKQTYIGHLVDIPARTICGARISVADDRILSIEHEADVPADAPYFLPGFCDAHIHIESSMMIPEQFARIAVQHGVVAAICDPHEITNVLGVKGIDFMVGNARNSRFGFFFGLPSCVPSSHLETAGAVIDAAQTRELIRRDDLWFLAEMMNFPGLLADDPEVWAKLQAAKDARKPIDGHAPGVTGDALRKYIGAGVSTDHECSTLAEAREKIAMGMHILVREGSAARNFDALYPIIGEAPDRVMLCSDDKHPDGLIKGHIDALVRRAVARGLSVWDVLQTACINPVHHYGVPVGQLRKGDPATFIAVDNLANFNVLQTIIAGRKVFDHGSGLDLEALTAEHNSVTAPNNFNAQPITTADLQVTPTSDHVRVIVALDGELFTPSEIVSVDELAKGDIQKIMVYNRYGNGRPQVAYIRGFALREGALGATIAHDSHNIVVIGCDDASIVRMTNALIAAKGGIGYVAGNEAEVLPLPIAGLMSDEPAEQTAAKYQSFLDHAHALGCPLESPYITMSFMELPVIPELKLTDKGLVDVSKFDFVNLFV